MNQRASLAPCLLPYQGAEARKGIGQDFIISTRNPLYASELQTSEGGVLMLN